MLFVCSRNRKRSLTAEEHFKGSPSLEVRSAGTEPTARVCVNHGLIGWADVIFTMEKRHSSLLRLQFGDLLESKTLVCLQIPDDFEFMDEELIAALETGVANFLSSSDRS